MASPPNLIKGSFKPSAFTCPSQRLKSKQFQASTLPKPNACSTRLWTTQLKLGARRREVGLSASPAAAEAIVADAEQASTAEESTSPSLRQKKLGVVVKPIEKPRLVIKFIWMEKNIGLALDQTIPSYGTIPVSPYYFWPRKDAWEELKVLLESKPWISHKQMVILLNQATDIINLWQQSGGDSS
ncbi:small ribosomal subunit protein cS23-like isoform X2 [Malania oleifera]|uniref:small ribosomal subunit protein cS23-like isoform X2 n=1 Tax=Malania oleifera TaxID=397392 RepID=UPI0025AE6400|nr:small ribosomal subunit protein cS23-like isoform X2 [Malania oleifera]